MFALDWQVIAEIATTVSTIAFAASAIVVVLQLRQAARERYFSVTAHLFEIWQSPEFQHDQLFLLHKLQNPTWEEFCADGRGERAERAIHRVGGYYDRVGNLVRHNLIRKDDILPTIGGYAVAVWHHIAPLVKELRLRENAVLFDNYEALLPECRECYVPGIDQRDGNDTIPGAEAANGSVELFSAISRDSVQEPVRARAESVPQRGLRKVVQSMTEVAMETNGDLGAPAAFECSLPDTDGILHSLSEFTAAGPAVLVYARGAWCPFCLRQLSDYGEQYRTFRQSGIEVVAVSPESPRQSRRLRTGLKLPFTVLSDSKLQVAKNLGLMDPEKPGAPTPATLVLDRKGVKLSTLNQREKSLLARDVLQYLRATSLGNATEAIPPPQVAKPQPGILFARALANLAAGLVKR
jgi:peroxiredoxin